MCIWATINKDSQSMHQQTQCPTIIKLGSNQRVNAQTH
jgi:hypothetical protein